MNSKEIVDRLLDRLDEQAKVIERDRNEIEQLRRQAGRADANLNTIARLERDVRDHRERIKAVESAFNTWKAQNPKMKVPPSFAAALDLLVTEDIPF